MKSHSSSVPRTLRPSVSRFAMCNFKANCDVFWRSCFSAVWVFSVSPSFPEIDFSDISLWQKQDVSFTHGQWAMNLSEPFQLADKFTISVRHLCENAAFARSMTSVSNLWKQKSWFAKEKECSLQNGMKDWLFKLCLVTLSWQILLETGLCQGSAVALAAVHWKRYEGAPGIATSSKGIATWCT